MMINMEKGQGSLEYLLILAAILVIAVAVVVVANAFGSQGSKQVSVQDDSYRASLVGANLIGYTQPYSGDEATAPKAVSYKGKTYDVAVLGGNALKDKIDNTINNHGKVEYITYLTGAANKYYVLLVAIDDTALLSTVPMTKEEIEALPKQFVMEEDPNHPNACISLAFGDPCPDLVT